MCVHRDSRDREDCALAWDDAADRLTCQQHPPRPIPRQRTDDLDLLVAVMQREATA